MGKSKYSIRLKSQIGMQLLKTCMILMTLVGLEKVLEYRSFTHRESRLL
jgi:hypothetical protein